MICVYAIRTKQNNTSFPAKNTPRKTNLGLLKTVSDQYIITGFMLFQTQIRLVAQSFSKSFQASDTVGAKRINERPLAEKIDAASVGFRSLTDAIDTTPPARRMMM